MTLDDLAFGAGTRQRLAGDIYMSDPGIVIGLGAELFTEGRGEVATPAHDELLGEHEVGLGRACAYESIAGGACGGEGLAGGFGSASRGIEAGLCFTRITDGGCEISAPDPLIALTSFADRS